MEVLKISIDWVKSELLSAKIVWLFSFLTLITSLGFATLGKTTTAKAFVLPLIISAAILFVIGVGLYAANKPRIKQFEYEYSKNPKEFIDAEIKRTSKSDNDFSIVFIVLPLIIITSAILFITFPSIKSRVINTTIILTVVFLMIVDSNTSARNAKYREDLLKIHNDGKSISKKQ